MKENKLEGSMCYLVGPIDFVEDKGVGFRKEITEALEGKGIVFLDPTDKLDGLTADVGAEQDVIKDFKDKKDYVGLRKFMKKIVRSDLRCVDYSDFIIAYIDTDIHMCGSYHEIVCAINQKKPVLAVINGGIQNAPSWLFGILHTDLMFDDIDSLEKYCSNEIGRASCRERV